MLVGKIDYHYLELIIVKRLLTHHTSFHLTFKCLPDYYCDQNQPSNLNPSFSFPKNIELFRLIINYYISLSTDLGILIVLLVVVYKSCMTFNVIK